VIDTYKKISAFFLVLLMIPCICFADPIITSDSRTFDVMKGIYNLQGHVFVQFPVGNNLMTIKGDATKVHLYKMEVHGHGNISLSFDDINFLCDQVDVYHKQETAYLTGNMHLKTNTLDIVSDKGSYCWKTKLATFIGNVKVNGEAKPDNIQYNMVTKKFVY